MTGLYLSGSLYIVYVMVQCQKILEVLLIFYKVAIIAHSNNLHRCIAHWYIKQVNFVFLISAFAHQGSLY